MSETPKPRQPLTPEARLNPEFLKELTEGLKLAIDSSDRVMSRAPVSRQVIVTDTVQVDQPGKHGFLPDIERRRQVDASLSGRPVPSPVRYSPQDVELTTTSTVITEEERAIVPHAKVVLLIETGVDQLLNVNNRIGILSDVADVLEIFPQLSQAVAGSDMGPLGLDIFFKIKSVYGTTLQPAFFTRLPKEPHLTTREDLDAYWQGLGASYEKALIEDTIKPPTIVPGREFKPLSQSFLNSMDSTDFRSWLEKTFLTDRINNPPKSDLEYLPPMVCINVTDNDILTRFINGQVFERGRPIKRKYGGYFVEGIDTFTAKRVWKESEWPRTR